MIVNTRLKMISDCFYQVSLAPPVYQDIYVLRFTIQRVCKILEHGQKTKCCIVLILWYVHLYLETSTCLTKFIINNSSKSSHLGTRIRGIPLHSSSQTRPPHTSVQLQKMSSGSSSVGAETEDKLRDLPSTNLRKTMG